jgi:hypothetical protein
MIATVLVIFVSMIHALIAIIEMCFWHLPKPHSRLGVDAETAKQVAPIVLRMSKGSWSEKVTHRGVIPNQFESLTSNHAIIRSGFVLGSKWRFALNSGFVKPRVVYGLSAYWLENGKWSMMHEESDRKIKKRKRKSVGNSRTESSQRML